MSSKSSVSTGKTSDSTFTKLCLIDESSSDDEDDGSEIYFRRRRRRSSRGFLPVCSTPLKQGASLLKGPTRIRNGQMGIFSPGGSFVSPLLPSLSSTPSTSSPQHHQQSPPVQSSTLRHKSRVVPKTSRKQSASVGHSKRPNPVDELPQPSTSRVLPQKHVGRPVEHARRRHNRQGGKALKEIQMLQKSTNLLIKKLPFSRLVREVCMNISEIPHFFEARALEALQEASESYLVSIFEESLLCSYHARRVTLKPEDIQLVRRLKEH